jgi:hypothetical protein
MVAPPYCGFKTLELIYTISTSLKHYWAAFGKVITSIVNDLIMPFFGLILGSVNFADLYISLDGKHYETLDEAKSAPILGMSAMLI